MHNNIFCVCKKYTLFVEHLLILLRNTIYTLFIEKNFNLLRQFFVLHRQKILTLCFFPCFFSWFVSQHLCVFFFIWIAFHYLYLPASLSSCLSPSLLYLPNFSSVSLSSSVSSACLSVFCHLQYIFTVNYRSVSCHL